MKESIEQIYKNFSVLSNDNKVGYEIERSNLKLNVIDVATNQMIQ